MTRLPVVTSRQMEKVLFYLGFEAARSRGSHVFYRHPDGRTTTLPHHAGTELTKPLLREILREIEMSTADLVEMLEAI